MTEVINKNMEYEYVVKRNGDHEKVYFDKINLRIEKLCENLSINSTRVTRDITKEMYNGIHTYELDELGAQIAASLSTEHPDYGKLASKIIISNHHKNTSPSFTETMRTLYENTDIHGNHTPLITKTLFHIIQENQVKLNDIIRYQRDYYFDYFGFKTLERSYLMRLKSDNKKKKGRIVERPQHMFMRVALGIHGSNIKDAINTYNLMSNKFFIHATPTLFNAGTNRPQLSSCFLLAMKSDSIDGIYSTLKDCAMISKWAGGIGLHAHNIRAKNTQIRGTNGISNGLVPMLRVFNNTARYVDQCFSAKTLVYTKTGLKRIDSIVSNDMVLTKNNTFNRVKKSIVHQYKGPGLIFNFNGIVDHTEPVVTPEHPIYSLKVHESDDKYTILGRLTSNLCKADFYDARELNEKDYICYPMNYFDHTLDIKELSQEECYIIGLLVTHGLVRENAFHLELSSDYDIDFTRHYLDQKTIRYTISVENGKSMISWKQTMNSSINKNLFMNIESNSLHIHSHLLQIAREKMVAFINAIFKGKLIYTHESKQLIYSLVYMFNKLEMFPNRVTDSTIYMPKNKFTEELFPDTYIPLNKTKDFRYKNFYYRYIEHIGHTNVDEDMYDFEIDETPNYCTELGLAHNGGGKRNGSIAIYLEPWHADIFDFLLLKKNHGNEEDRARDLFYALWIPDLFMKRVKSGGKWTLMCPDECPGLSDVYGEEFETLYTSYERQLRGAKTIDAQKLWYAILESQIETGTPYMVYKDACNSKSNQKNLGTIKSSNLCTEIIEYSSPTEFAVCNLASIGLPKFMVEEKQVMNDVEIYSVINCKYCTLSKELLNQKNIPFKEHLLDTDESKKQYLGTVNTRCEDGVCQLVDKDNKVKSFPQIYMNNERIGGYNELVERLSERMTFDFDKLIEVTKTVTRNLNKVIDINYYPVKETKRSNFLHRPVGIGIQGLADVFAMRGIAFDSDEAQELNRRIFETIYFASLSASNELAKERETIIKEYNEYIDEDELYETIHDTREEYLTLLDKMRVDYNIIPEELDRDEYLGTYSSYIGSPMSKGILQFDMWDDSITSPELDWDSLRNNIKQYGIRNSLLVAPMPTASTSQILGNNECFEPFTNNIYVRRTLAGEFIVINKHLVSDLVKLGIWNKDIKNKIIEDNGSIQSISGIPQRFKNIYKTVWETSNKTLINMAADRGKFICQSQSLNLFVEKPNFNNLSSMHMYSWQKGLKTGLYYLRTRPVAAAQKFTIEPDKQTRVNESVKEIVEEEECLSCGS
jgi:ribonucleotide reductase alpha subunit